MITIIKKEKRIVDPCLIRSLFLFLKRNENGYDRGLKPWETIVPTIFFLFLKKKGWAEAFGLIVIDPAQQHAGLKDNNRSHRSLEREH